MTVSTKQQTPFWPTASQRKIKSNKEVQAAWGGALPVPMTLGQLLAKDLPPRNPVVAPWLHLGESCLLWGGTGTGKSMIALTLALMAAGGGEVFNWSCRAPTNVLYVDGEQSERDLKKRLELLPTAINGFDSSKASRNLVVLARSSQEGSGKFLDIANPAQAETIASAAEAGKFGLIVFDNLSTLSDTISEENSAGEFKPMQVLLTRLKKANVAVILVHHSGKDPSKGYRGSSAIGTTFERILGVVHNASAPVTQIDATVSLEKFRDEIPQDFQPVFPLKFSVAVDAAQGKRTVRWSPKVGQAGSLNQSQHNDPNVQETSSAQS